MQRPGLVGFMRARVCKQNWHALGKKHTQPRAVLSCAAILGRPSATVACLFETIVIAQRIMLQQLVLWMVWCGLISSSLVLGLPGRLRPRRLPPPVSPN